MSRRRRRRGRDQLSGLAVAFGLGLLLALFCSVRLALILTAAALVYLGWNKWC